jgi:GAF domain-containing protein
MTIFPTAFLPINQDKNERPASSLLDQRFLPQQEDIFDELVALNAYLFGVPISYITLADADYLRYCASYNTAPPPPAPREQMLCTQVIEQNRVLSYHDLAATHQTDTTVTAIQHALAQQARFYAGAPVRIPGQSAIGTLCLVGHQPRSFSTREQQVLEHLACIVSQTVRRHCLYHQAPVLNETTWQVLRGQVRDEIRALVTLVRYLLRRHGPTVPVPKDTLHLVTRRLQDIHILLQEGL